LKKNDRQQKNKFSNEKMSEKDIIFPKRVIIMHELSQKNTV